MSYVTLLEKKEAEVPTPPPGVVYLYYDAATKRPVYMNHERKVSPL